MEEVISKKGPPYEEGYPPGLCCYYTKRGIVLIEYGQDGIVQGLTGLSLDGPEGSFLEGDSIQKIKEKLGEPDFSDSGSIKYIRSNVVLSVDHMDSTIRSFTLRRLKDCG